MIEQRASRLSRHTLTLSFALSVFFPVLCAGQTSAPASGRLSAPSNPRASSDDPRVGLKAGLYDAGEAVFGLEKLASIPKPPGFAPGNFIPNGAPPAATGAAEPRVSLRGLLRFNTVPPTRIWLSAVTMFLSVTTTG